jgi:hypothetical protein
MKHHGLPEKFTRLGVGVDGREYVQCTRTGDVLVQTGDDEWGHFAYADEWRDKTGPALYPQLVHLTRTLKEVGRREEVETQVEALRAAIALLGELEGTLRNRIVELESGGVVAPVGG